MNVQFLLIKTGNPNVPSSTQITSFQYVHSWEHYQAIKSNKLPNSIMDESQEHYARQKHPRHEKSTHCTIL